MKSYIRQKAWHAARLVLCIVPIPFIGFATDWSYLISLSFLVFILASLAAPCTVRYRQQKTKGQSDYAAIGPALYGGIIGLLIAIGVLNGIMLSPLWKTYAYRLAFFAFWMIGTVVGQTLLAWALDAWQQHRRAYWFSEFLDPVLYALPIPCALMGMFMFPGSGEAGVTSSLIIGMLGIISFGFIAIVVLVMATFAFYFYPKPAQYPKKINKVLGLVRVVLMTLIYLGIHYAFFSGDELPFRYFLYYGLPLTQNNPLVFVSVFVLESFFIVVSVAISNILLGGIERLISRTVQHKA